jgi:hypothetical protein
VDLSADLRDALGEFAEPVTLPNGSVVQGAPSVASSQDSLDGGETIVAGRTRVLRLVAADAPDLREGQNLTWNSRQWRVLRVQLAAMGQLLRVFLGQP